MWTQHLSCLNMMPELKHVNCKLSQFTAVTLLFSGNPVGLSDTDSQHLRDSKQLDI